MKSEINKENICVYESLREEILATQGTRANIIMYMYVVYISLFVIAMEWSSYIFLLTFIVLIPFQAKIVRCKYMISKLSAYIKIFFEEERTDMHWETLHKSSVTKAYFTKMDNNFISKLSGTGAVQLGILSAVCFIWQIMQKSYIVDNKILYITPIDIFLIILAIIGVVVIAIVNSEYKRNYVTELEDYIRQYKKEQ